MANLDAVAIGVHLLIWAAGGFVLGLVTAFLWAVVRFLRGLGARRPRGLRAAEIEEIPVYVYTSGGAGAGEAVGTGGDGPRREGNRECPVCLEDFVEGDELCLLPCRHAYHKGCARPWLRKVSICPKCTSPVLGEVPPR